MHLAAIDVWSTGIVTLTASVACVTDLRDRRIPNQLTLPAITFGLVSHLAAGGWGGGLFAATGALLAPALLAMLHGAKGPGAGDLKLASVFGANLGPICGTVAVLISAVAGGFLAGIWLAGLWLRNGGHSRLLRRTPAPVECPEHRSAGTAAIIPYGLALSAGALVTLFLYWNAWSGKWLM